MHIRMRSVLYYLSATMHPIVGATSTGKIRPNAMNERDAKSNSKNRLCIYAIFVIWLQRHYTQQLILHLREGHLPSLRP